MCLNGDHAIIENRIQSSLSWQKGVFVIKTVKTYIFVALVLLLLFSPFLFEAIVHPVDYNEENLPIDYPPRIMYNDVLYKAIDDFRGVQIGRA